MAKNKFSLNFEGFLDYARELDELGENLLKEATIEALERSREEINICIGRAMKESPYSFQKGVKRSFGDARKSLIEVSQMETEVVGNVVTAYAGVDLKKAPEVSLLANGTPHLRADTNLKNAIKVKGKYRKIINNIQFRIFTDKIKQNGGGANG